MVPYNWPGVGSACHPASASVGDRQQEIVFIGADPMNQAAIRAEPDAGLINST
ncbi:cobalamin biosynthesis protein CobW (plasmid) [Agrobacterium tumefaciens]|nr:cobalamin biosynthesis protein CobW [Agrobacterium tumefaciens]